MAQVDTNIAMGFRPVQIESPINQMAAIAQLRGAQEASQMNALKMQEYQRGMQQRNALATIHADPNVKVGSPEYLTRVQRDAPDLFEGVVTRAQQRAELEEKVEKRKFENFERKFGLFKTLLPSVQNEYDVVEYTRAAYDDPDLKPYLEAIRPVERAIESNTAEFYRDPDNWRMQAAGADPVQLFDFSQKKQKAAREEADYTAPKPKEIDVGGRIEFRDVNPRSNTFGQIVGPETIAKTPAPAAPSKVVQLQSELANAEKTYGVNSPQAKQIRDEIEQETGGLERQRIANERYRARKGEGGGAGAPGPGTKLEKGERWNAEEQRIETVPGSKLHVAQSDKHNKDRDALKGVETKTSSAITKIDELLSPKYIDGFRANFSGDVPFSGYVTQYAAPDSRRRIDSLKSDMKAAGLELIRVGGSIGAMTQQEWPIVEQMIAALTPDMTADEAETQVKKIRAYMERIKANAKDSYQTEWGGTQYFKPLPGDTSPRELTAQDKEALKWANSNPKDPRAAQIKQRLGVKP
jgi:hypothetical protein